LRRTILSDIPTTVIYTETYKDNQCNIEINNTRLHNEIIKQRLSCIPVHIKELDVLPNNYMLELDVKNKSESNRIVTTQDFKIKNKKNGNYLTENEKTKIFPPCPKTNMFIDVARLRPGNGPTILGEQLKLTAEFSVHTAKENSMFNVVSTCSYGNTVDSIKAKGIWDDYEKKLESEQHSKKSIEMQKKNFYLLDAQRYYLDDSFDFLIQTIGVYDNKEIVKKACKVLIDKLENMITNIEADIIPIRPSEVTMNNSYDIILENEDYTIGKMLEFILYDTYYQGAKILSFCGFKKFHPHDDESIIRIAYNKNGDKQMVRNHLTDVCNKGKEIYTKIYKMF
jgi:DNA-directed RNA polymerase subunit L